MSKNFIITIGREYGSGGLEIGQKLAEKLGIKCYDKELINLVAEEKGYDKEKLEKGDEKRGNFVKEPTLKFFGNKASKNLPGFNGYGMTNNDEVYLLESSIIKELAEKESCVIIGRCADSVLQSKDNVLKVFIQAPKGARIKRLTERLHVSEDEAEREMNRVDQIRSSYYQFYTDNGWGSREGYDLILNSAAIGIDNTVDVIKNIVETNFK
jgi:cytidylate kinase